MPDGRRNNGGHSTKGKAGRPAKAQELKLAEKIRNVIQDEEIIANLADIAKTAKRDSDRIKANEILAGYLWGKAPQTVDMTSGGEKVHTPVISFIKTGKGED